MGHLGLSLAKPIVQSWHSVTLTARRTVSQASNVQGVEPAWHLNQGVLLLISSFLLSPLEFPLFNRLQYHIHNNLTDK